MRTSPSFGLNVPSDEDLVETPQGAAISLYTRRWRDNPRSRVAIGQGGPYNVHTQRNGKTELRESMWADEQHEIKSSLWGDVYPSRSKLA